jgi:hypothetical protein
VKRRAPGWAVESVAWATALVLFAGVAVVVFGGIGTRTTTTRTTQAIAETPVLKPVPAAVTVTATPAPVVVAKKPLRVRATTDVPIETSLGAPPGPEHDIAPAATAPPEMRYAFLVGVTRYRKPTHDTIAGAQDVQFIQQSLIANGWLPQNIRMVTNEQATGAAIRSGMTWLAGQSVPGTFTLFHFSGHVKQADGHEMLWPYDRDFVPDSDVTSVLNRGTGKLWVDIAGCEAAGFMDGLPSARVLFSSSSRSTQKSYEYPQWGESVWAGLLWDLSLGQGQADADHNGITTIGEALRYSTYYAQAITLRQVPYGRQTPQVAGDGIRGWTLSNPPA